MENTKDKEIYEQEVGNLGLRTKAKNIVTMLIEQDKSQAYRHVEEQDFQELMYEVLRRVRQIPLDKTVSPARIQELLSEDGVKFSLNGGADLNEKIHREYNRIRFYEYSQQLLKAAHSKGVRGHYFEGLLAGLFNGEVVSTMEGEMTDPKEDVLIDGINYSAKLVRAQDKRWGTSSLLGGFKQALIQRLVDRDVEVPDELLKRKLEERYLNDLIELFPEGDPDRDAFQIRHMTLFLKDENIDRKYKQITLEHAFTTKSEEEIGRDLHWIFGLIWGTNETFEGEDLPVTNLRYYLIDTDSLIAGILDGNIHYIKGRNMREIRIAEESMIEANGASSHSIVFPVVTREDLKNLLYDENSEEMVYKVMGIFKDLEPGTEKYIHHQIVDTITDNPQEFIKRLQDLFPDKDINESLLENKTIINEQKDINFETMTPKLWSLVKLSYEISASSSLPVGLEGFQKTLGEFFYINDYEQAVTLWLIIEYNAEYYDIAAREVIQLPVEDVKVPPTIWDIEYYYKGYYEEYTEEEECVDYEGEVTGEECDCETYEDIEVVDEDGDYEWVSCDEAPDKDRKKAGYNNEYDCPCEEFEYKEYSKYSYPTSYARVFSLSKSEAEVDDDFNDLRQDDTHVLVEDDERYEDNYDEAETWDYFHDGEEGEIIDIVAGSTETSWYLSQLNFKLYNIKESLTEDSDIFGQGLLEPIDPEEFEGDDEEWEKMMTDTVYDAQTDTTLEPRYEYTGGTTDPSKGFVAPSAEVTNNICSVEGFCQEQGPITFGQLKALVEAATNKRIGADIGRGVFKTMWRIVPFFIPQILLAAVGVTVTRAINKIITPALTDTRGYKSWWGKVVLKAMDIAEGDYIPDIALGDDPLSKIFFISDGLMAMIKDKYKLKFARYVADVAASQPDNKPVPEWFVENLLRNYLNQKFLLNPPLQIKTDIEKKKIDESEGDVVEQPEPEPFTKLETTILNYLAKQFTREELELISSTDWSGLGTPLKTKYMDYLKYFGIDASDGHEEWAKGTRFAKWITDNRDEAERIKEIELGDDFDPTITYDLDLGLVTNPIKDWPNMYEVMGTETGWEQVYRSGYIDMPAYDEDDAHERAEEHFWDYDPDMETSDYGDYEADRFEIDDSYIELSRSLREHIMSISDDDNEPDLSRFDNLMVKAIFTKSGGWGRPTQKFIIYLTPTGVVKSIKRSSSTTPSQIHFNEGEKLTLGSLIKFEKQSGFELQMVGRLREDTKLKGINKSIKNWVDKEFNLVLDHNNVPTFLSKETEKLNTYTQANNLVCEIWGKEHNYKLDVNDFTIKNINIKYNNYNNLVFENLTNSGVTLPLDTLKHYLNKNIKEETKDNVLEGKNININKLHDRLIKLGFIKEDQPTQRIVLEWLNDVIKETNKNGVITEEGKIEYVDNLTESYDTHLPHGLGVPEEIFFNTFETFRPEVLKDLKPHINEFMYYCLGFEEMKPEDSEDWYSMDPSAPPLSYTGHKTVEDILSESCSDAYNRIWEIIREVERRLKNMGILEPRVKVENGERIVNYYEDDLPASLVNLYTQLFSEIDKRLKSSREGMPMVNRKETQKLVEDSRRAHSYSGGRHSNPQEVEVGDIIRLIHMDDPQGIAVGSYGEVVGFDNDPWENRILVVWDLPNGEKRNLPLYPSIDTFMVHEKREQINEQDNQLSAFPTGQFEFTVHEDENDAKWLEKTVSDDVIKVLFKKWDEDGINLKMFKYLGIPRSSLVASYTIKRYLQNTKVPVQVSYRFDCDELAELFDTTHRDYNMDYINEYLCGDDSFWDHEDWYNYEWESYLLDQIDEGNWKTISKIFGGVSQEVAEHILSEQPQNEEEEELIEEYQEDIDEIQNFIVWANNDETEWATKDAMVKDMEDKLAEHFQEEGRLVTDDNGKKSWVIEGDLRDYINDQWDNTETITYSEDYRENVLEDIMMDMSPEYISTDALFGILMREEYSFHDYCEGKRGDCLDVETKFFDGYWYPQIDINESLANRLGELTYEPEITTPEGETIPLQENKNIPHWGLYQLLKKTSNVNNHRRKKVFDFLNVLQNLGLVNMYQSPDFLWSGSKWLTKYLDLKHPELLEEPDEDMPDGRGEIGYDGEWHHNDALKKARYLLDNADTVRDTVLMMLMDSTEDPSSIKVESQMRPFAVDLVKLWAETK